jgi:hypothetical protein
MQPDENTPGGISDSVITGDVHHHHYQQSAPQTNAPASTGYAPPQQPQQVVYGLPQQQFVAGMPGQQVMMMVQEQKQDGLIISSYILSAIALLFFPICFGPIAFILAIIANSKGDSRGGIAMIIAGVATLAGMIFGMLVFASMS